MIYFEHPELCVLHCINYVYDTLWAGFQACPWTWTTTLKSVGILSCLQRMLCCMLWSFACSTLCVGWPLRASCWGSGSHCVSGPQAPVLSWNCHPSTHGTQMCQNVFLMSFRDVDCCNGVGWHALGVCISPLCPVGQKQSQSLQLQSQNISQVNSKNNKNHTKIPDSKN